MRRFPCQSASPLVWRTVTSLNWTKISITKKSDVQFNLKGCRLAINNAWYSPKSLKVSQIIPRKTGGRECLGWHRLRAEAAYSETAQATPLTTETRAKIINQTILFFLTPGHAQKPKPILWWLYCLQVGSQWRSSSQQGNHLGSMRETTTLIFLVLLERLDFNFSLGPHNSSWIGVRHVWQIQGRQFSNIIIRHVCLPKFGTPKVTNPR